MKPRGPAHPGHPATAASSAGFRTPTATCSPPTGVRWAVFYSNVHNRLPGPLLATDEPHAPVELRRALRVIDAAVDSYVDAARIRPAA